MVVDEVAQSACVIWVHAALALSNWFSVVDKLDAVIVGSVGANTRDGCSQVCIIFDDLVSRRLQKIKMRRRR